jgi:hypothetical protein
VIANPTKVTVVQMGSGPYSTHYFIECSLCGTVGDSSLMFAAQRANDHRALHDDAKEES